MTSGRPAGPGGIPVPADRPARARPSRVRSLPRLNWPTAPGERFGALASVDGASQSGERGRRSEQDSAYRRVRRLLGRSHAHALLAARDALRTLGGLATVEEVAELAGRRLRPESGNGTGSEGIVDANLASNLAEQPPVSDARAFLRWIVDLADDPALRLRQDRYLVGPPIGAEDFDHASARVEELLEVEPSVSVEHIASELGPSWVEPGGNALRRRAQLLGRLHGEEIARNRFASRSRSLADWAERVMEEEGAPLHWREVARRVNQTAAARHDPAALRDALGEDDRFVRVGGGDYSLRSWGAEPYTRFAEVLERYLRRREAPVHEDQITADLRRLYTLRPRTMISAMEEDPKVFRTFGEGVWGLAGVHTAPAS